MEQQSAAEAEAYALSLGLTPAYIQAAEQAYMEGRVELAELACMRPEELQALYLQAYHTLRSNRPVTAARLFLSLTQFDRRQARFYVGLGQCFQQMHEFGYAHGTYLVALRTEPDHRIALVLYGECTLLMGNRTFAEKVFARALALGPTGADDLVYLERAKSFLARLRNEQRGLQP